MKANAISNTGRKAISLENDSVKTVIEALGGMVPEFLLKRGGVEINTHWIPDFRGNPNEPYDPLIHAKFWKEKLLRFIAGDFPCGPSFGASCVVDGTEVPTHGWVANEEWEIKGHGVSSDDAIAFAHFELPSPTTDMPLSWKKCDMVLEGQAAYYSVLRVKNEGAVPIAINLARHNTLGAPFLAEGCKISLSADRFQTAPYGSGFDVTGRLLPGAEFFDLCKAPLRDGGTTDLSHVHGMVGATDFISGAIPQGLSLGWSCLVNPSLGLAYVSFFPGENSLPPGEVALGFNDLWLQYGGRRFTPWSLDEGGDDRVFCLGTENTVGAYANGLAFARKHPEIMGRQTTVMVPAYGERKLCYGTAIIELHSDLIVEGVRNVEAEHDCLVLKGTRTIQRVAMDAQFVRVREFEDK